MDSAEDRQRPLWEGSWRPSHLWGLTLRQRKSREHRSFQSGVGRLNLKPTVQKVIHSLSLNRPPTDAPMLSWTNAPPPLLLKPPGAHLDFGHHTHRQVLLLIFLIGSFSAWKLRSLLLLYLFYIIMIPKLISKSFLILYPSIPSVRTIGVLHHT